jgi:glycerol-3-phosphate cytidylyltransferase
MKNYKIGYTQGTFDMFHIGHLNLLNHAKEQCDYLVVGVNADALVEEYKHKTPVINEIERAEIVRNIKAVDRCEITHTLDKKDAYERFHFDVIFIGDDWKGNSRWQQTEEEMQEIGVDLVFLPHTAGVSSSALTTVIKSILDEEA